MSHGIFYCTRDTYTKQSSDLAFCLMKSFFCPYYCKIKYDNLSPYYHMNNQLMPQVKYCFQFCINECLVTAYFKHVYILVVTSTKHEILIFHRYNVCIFIIKMSFHHNPLNMNMIKKLYEKFILMRIFLL